MKKLFLLPLLAMFLFVACGQPEFKLVYEGDLESSELNRVNVAEAILGVNDSFELTFTDGTKIIVYNQGIFIPGKHYYVYRRGSGAYVAYLIKKRGKI